MARKLTDNPDLPDYEELIDGGEKSQEIRESKPEETPDELKARIKKLEAELAKSNAAKDIAEEESARLSAQAQVAFMTSSVAERHAGTDEAGNDLWWYRIDLPPSGGTDIKINGNPYYHGETYKFTTDVLQCVKEIVSRTWGHENNINGSNENFYRPPQNRVLGNPNKVPHWARG